jgi:hypothetical protein
VVTFEPPLRIISGSATVTLAAGSALTVDYVVDSGIRLPVAQQ